MLGKRGAKILILFLVRSTFFISLSATLTSFSGRIQSTFRFDRFGFNSEASERKLELTGTY